MSIKQRGRRLAFIAVGTCLALVIGCVTAPAVAAASAPSSSHARDRDDRTEPVLLFAADGMRQDLIEKYIKSRRGSLPLRVISGTSSASVMLGEVTGPPQLNLNGEVIHSPARKRHCDTASGEFSRLVI